MTRYERDQLVQVLYQVQIVSSKTSSLIGILDNAVDKIRANFEIDGEGPKAPAIVNMSTDSVNAVSSYQNHVIPNLIYRINSYVEEEE